MRNILAKFQESRAVLITLALVVVLGGASYISQNRPNAERVSANASWCPASESFCTDSADLRFRGYDYYYADQYGGGGGGWSSGGYNSGYEEIDSNYCPGELVFEGGRKVCKTGKSVSLNGTNRNACYSYGLTARQLQSCLNTGSFSQDVDLGEAFNPNPNVSTGSFGFNGIDIRDRGYYDGSYDDEGPAYQDPETILANQIEVNYLERSLGCVAFQYPEYVPANADQLTVSLISNCEQTPKKLNLWLGDESIGKCKNQDSCTGTVAIPVKKAGKSYNVRAVYNYGLLGLAKQEISVSIPVR